MIDYFVEFLKFLCGFGLIIALSLILLSFTASGGEAFIAFPHVLA